jgi:hypothetical protein
MTRVARLFARLAAPPLAAALTFAVAPAPDPSEPPAPSYSIEAIRYGIIRDFPVSALVMGAPKDEKTDIAMVVWLIRGGGRNVLFDSGFHREVWLKEFPTADYMRPDEAVKLAGVKADEVTDVVISHAHWDHMGGIDLFPKATVWIQKQEFAYYTGDAWQPGGKHGGIDPDDVRALVRRNLEGHVRSSTVTTSRSFRASGRIRDRGTPSPRSSSPSRALGPSSWRRTTATCIGTSLNIARARRSAWTISPRTSGISRG